MCYDSLRVMRPTRPLYFMLNLAGSGHDFRGVCFSVAYTTPNGKSCRTFPKTRSIYHNSRCTPPPLKRPQSLSGAKKRKKDKKTPGQTRKRVRIVFRALHNYARKRCAIGFVRSEHRTAQNDKFSPGAWRSDGVSCFQTSHLARTKKKTDLGSVARIRVYGKYFSYRMLNIHKRKKMPQ